MLQEFACCGHCDLSNKRTLWSVGTKIPMDNTVPAIMEDFTPSSSNTWMAKKSDQIRQRSSRNTSKRRHRLKPSSISRCNSTRTLTIWRKNTIASSIPMWTCIFNVIFWFYMYKNITVKSFSGLLSGGEWEEEKGLDRVSHWLTICLWKMHPWP